MVKLFQPLELMSSRSEWFDKTGQVTRRCSTQRNLPAIWSAFMTMFGKHFQVGVRPICMYELPEPAGRGSDRGVGWIQTHAMRSVTECDVQLPVYKHPYDPQHRLDSISQQVTIAHELVPRHGSFGTELVKSF